VYIESNAHSKLDAKSRKCFFISYGDEFFVIGFGMVKIGRSLKLEMLLLMSRLCTRIGQVQNLWLQLELEKFEFVS
jgi:hypothetical protein